MRRLALLAALCLVGCAPQAMRFGLHVTDMEAGSVVAADGGVHRALVYAYDATTSLRPEAVEWTFGGVFEPGPEPGTFRAKGAGEGTIAAAFRAGDRQVLAAKLMAKGPAPAVVARPVSPPPPAATPAPTPVPPPALPDAETLVMDSYRLQGQGDYYGAVQQLLAVSDPDWQPKVRALMAEWGERGADQGLTRARGQLDAGNRTLAKETLEVVARLPLRPTQRQTERALRLKLGDRP